MVEIIVTENGNVRGVFTRVISASLTDSLNGECTFQFSVISSMASEIFTGLEVQLKSDTLNYLFNVVKVSKSLSNGIAICTVECEHKSYELNNDEYKLNEFDFEGAPSECLISLLQGTSLTAGICDPTVPIKLKINRECTRRAALMQLIALCGGEIEYNGAEINIRSHRGSQDYIGIMDGRNVSDLTMETDNRSGTTNYGLTLYKNVNFSVGDNVQIVFHPFNLNVNTRIIAMSFNPYNRREISIEVGDYRPSISDNLYQMEQKTNEIRKSYKFKFSEPMPVFIKRERERKTLEPTIRAVFPDAWSPKIITPPPITVVNVSNRKLYLELRNPVKADEIAVFAFTMIVTTEKETVRLQPISADFGMGDFGSTIWLAFGSSAMKDSVQSITLLYDGDVGNLTDVLNNAPCGSFQTSFIYVPFEEEET